MAQEKPEGLHPSHPDYDPDDFSYRGGPPKKDPSTPVIDPTKYYDGFDGFTYPGARPAKNPDREDDRDRGDEPRLKCPPRPISTRGVSPPLDTSRRS
jgi:hypothetical protein